MEKLSTLGKSIAGFILFPGWGLDEEWDETKQSAFEADDIALRRSIMQILIDFDLGRHAPTCKTIEVHVKEATLEGTPIAKAHSVWNPDYLQNIHPPANFPSKALETPCPQSIHRVEISCIESDEQDMKSNWYSFDGVFISALIDLNAKTVFDARGEHT